MPYGETKNVQLRPNHILQYMSVKYCVYNCDKCFVFVSYKTEIFFIVWEKLKFLYVIFKSKKKYANFLLQFFSKNSKKSEVIVFESVMLLNVLLFH